MKNFSKSILGMATAVVVAGTSVVPMAGVLAYGDNSANGRNAYTMQMAENTDFGTTPVFNSITDNAAFGNEFNFVGARVDGASTTEPDEITVQDGQTYIIRLYYHNNNANSVAINTQARFYIPTEVGKSITVMGYLTADNSNPTEYWDHVVFKSNDDFYLEYVEGSALLQNNGIGAYGGVQLSDDVVWGGVQVGYNSLNGEVPGCYEYDGSVIAKVVAKKVNYTFEKTVRKAGTNDAFTESVDAKVGDKVEFKIHFKNNSSAKAEDVTLYDELPSNLKYTGNTTITNSKYTNQVLSSHIVDGVHIGNYKSGSEADVYFTAEVVGTIDCNSSNNNINKATLTVGVNDAVVMTDTASVVVNGEQCKKQDPVPETPKYIVSTGAGEIGAGALGVGAVITALGYYIASRKKLM